MHVFPVFLAGFLVLLFCTVVQWAETAVSPPPTPLISFEELPNLDTFGQGVLDITHAGDDRLFLAIRHGQIRTYDLSTEQMLDTFADAFLDISNRVDSTGEGGLPGIAFSPNFATDGYLYTSYTTSGTLTTVISRFSISQTAPNRADPTSEHILIQFERPTNIHMGDDIAFGPGGYLYISQGDGGQRENAQELNDLFGSILRIDVTNAGNPPDCSPIGQYTIITAYGEDATGEIYVTWLDSVRRLQENTPVFKIYLPSIVTNQ